MPDKPTEGVDPIKTVVGPKTQTSWEELQSKGIYVVIKEGTINPYDIQGGVDFWALHVSYDVNGEAEQITVTVTLEQTQILSTLLNVINPSIGTGVNLGMWKCDVTLYADFQNRTLTASGTVSQSSCDWTLNCSWIDHSFNQVIVRW